MIKKLFITSIIIYLGLILLTSSPFQANNLFQDKTNTSVNDNIQSVYAQKNGDDDDDDNGKDDANENVVKTSLDEGNIPVTNIATSQNESLLSFSPSVGNTTTPALLQPDNQLVDKPSPSTILRN